MNRARSVTSIIASCTFVVACSGSGSASGGDASVCRDPGFLACGGEIGGAWRHVEFCDPAGQAASRERSCQGPGADEPACQGAGNTRACRAIYRVSADFRSGGELSLETALAGGVRYTFTDACLMKLGTASPAETCRAFERPALKCTYETGSCRCEGETEPLQSGRDTFPYSVEGSRLTIRSPRGTAVGGYCAKDGRLTIRFEGQGFEGWTAWILER